MAQRKAFRAWLVHDRRNQPTAAVTAVGMDQVGDRLFLGLEDGSIEEHRIVQDAQGTRSLLVARRQLSKKVGILCLCHTQIIFAATLVNSLPSFTS
jgi:hypothetical protein